MAARPATTVILLTRQVIVRADFNSANASLGVWRQARPDVQEWPLLAEIALGLGPRAIGKVFVLCSDLWTQTMTLPNVSTAGMSADEIASALNFEAESLSGQSAFESMVSAQTLPPNHGYWIVQARTLDIEQLSESMGRLRCRLGGVGHPGGLPRSLNRQAGSWVRLELWPDAVVLVRPDSQQYVVQVLNSDPQLGRWKPEWTAWCQGFAVAEQETLLGPAMAPPATGNAFVVLDQEPELVRWLTAWAECLNRRDPAVPLIRPARKPLSGKAFVMMGGVVAFLVLLGCLAVHLVLDVAARAADGELKSLQGQSKQLADLKKQTDDFKSKQKDLQVQVDHAENSLKVVGIHRLRLSKLLTVLREMHPEDLYIEKIDADGGDPTLHGRCLRPELADQFANQLAKTVSQHGWEVQSPKKEAMKIAANGGPWTFSIQIKSVKEMTLEKLDPKKGKPK